MAQSTTLAQGISTAFQISHFPANGIHSACSVTRTCRRPRFIRTPAACVAPCSIADATKAARNFHGTPSEAAVLARNLLNAIPTAREGTQEEDGRAIGSLYDALRLVGALRAFGTAPVTKRDTSISIERLVRESGLPISALAPKKRTVLGWQLAGVGAAAVVVALSRALHMDMLARPLLIAGGGLFALDQVALRGAIFERAYRIVLPQYAEKVLVHEAAHLICAYMFGLPVRGFVLSASDALRAGLPGQGGTLFFDARLASEIERGRLTQESVERHALVLMAGIAGEALTFGEAEGGESDVQALVQLLGSLQPPWDAERVRMQARWAVLQSINVLKENRAAYDAVCEAMRENRPLGDCIECIEQLAVSGVRSQE